jgi:hypothetical protein
MLGHPGMNRRGNVSVGAMTDATRHHSGDLNVAVQVL